MSTDKGQAHLQTTQCKPTSGTSWSCKVFVLIPNEVFVNEVVRLSRTGIPHVSGTSTAGWDRGWRLWLKRRSLPVVFLRLQSTPLPVSVPKDGVSCAFALHYFKASGCLLEHSGIKIPSPQLERIRSTVTRGLWRQDERQSSTKNAPSVECESSCTQPLLQGGWWSGPPRGSSCAEGHLQWQC